MHGLTNVRFLCTYYPWRRRQHDLSKPQELYPKRHGVTSPKLGNFNIIFDLYYFSDITEGVFSMSLRFEIQPTSINYILTLITPKTETGITPWNSAINVGTVCKISAFLIIHRLFMFCYDPKDGPGCSVCIVTGYGLNGLGIESRWERDFSAPVQTGPGAHPASCTMGTGSYPGVKNGRGVTLTLTPSSAVVKKG